MAKSHPYIERPDKSFWMRAISSGFSANTIMDNQAEIIRKDDRVMSAGSCFASNLVPYLEQSSITYLVTEKPHPAFAHLPENFGYRAFSAAYGNIYTARQLRQLIERSLGLFSPIEDRWHVGEHVVDPFRPGLRYPARSEIEFNLLTEQHLRATRTAFERCSVFVFTLGLTEAWTSVVDGAVFPACPGTISGTFDPGKHVFHNFTFADVSEDLQCFVKRLISVNPSVRVVLTVSPVPLVATASDNHVLVASTYSKAVLRAAAGEIAGMYSNVIYFPAYEIVTGPQAPHEYFEKDRRSVSKAGVRAVMDALLANCVPPKAPIEKTETIGAEGTKVITSDSHRLTEEGDPAFVLSRMIAERECEEAMVEVGISSNG